MSTTWMELLGQDLDETCRMEHHWQFSGEASAGHVPNFIKYEAKLDKSWH